MIWAAFWVVPRIESRIESAVSVALGQRGLEVSSISANGTSVTVVGGPTSPEARLALAAAVRNVPGVSEVRTLLLSDEDGPAQETTRLAEGGPGPGPLNPQHDDGEEGEEPVMRTAPSDVQGDGPPTAAPVGAGPRTDDPSEGSADEEDVDEPQPGGDAPEAAGPPPATDGPDAGRPATADSSNPSSPPPSVTTEAPASAAPAPCRVRLMRLAEGRTLAFNAGSSALSEADQGVLSELTLALRACGEWTLTIVGFASASEGRDAWILADRRAYGVARFLLDRGIDESRIATVTGNTPADEEGSPRVELFVSGGE